ncbi:MAG: hypothetical protein O7F73_19180 [Gammaproteobacteria bacterium]|nr:hypothetical protein [Gammaproteobacteria bacterium]
MTLTQLHKSLLFAWLLTSAGACAVPVLAAGDGPAAEPAQAEVAAEEDREWVDSGHDYVADGVNRMVQWMDDFYGTDTVDFEAASSKIRLRLGYGYDELEKGHFKVRVRGKVQLPKLSKRLALVAEGEDGDDFDRFGPSADDNDSQVGLQYKFGESGRNRLDGILSVNSSADLRLGIRFRHDGQYSDYLTGRLVQDLAYQTGDKGAFTRTRIDAFRRIDDDNLLAWINRVEYGEDTYGVEWSSSLQWRHRLEEETVISYMVGLDGVTDPDPLTENYGFAVNYRTNIYRKYLFVELEPAYMWRKQADFDSREGVWAINLRFEIHFETKPKPRPATPLEAVPDDPSAGGPLAWNLGSL